MFLKSDSARSHAVRPSVLLIGIAVPFAGILVTIAAVVTPFGLYDAYESASDRPGTFAFTPDKSPFGDSTAPRGNHRLSRVCSWGHGAAMGPAPCPYSGNTAIMSWNGTTYNLDVPSNSTSEVAPLLKEIYSSGTQDNKTTVSNYFDIEWRQFTTRNDRLIDNGTTFSVGMFRQVDSLILHDDIKPIEGLIVDARSGGVGFRNHTLPIGVDTGATWTEDILFIEPVTACIDTNLTLDFAITMNTSASVTGIKDLVLTDRGGFANLDQTYPHFNQDNPQVDPDLIGRAYKAAWLNNAYAMNFLNVTNPNNSVYGNKSFTYLQSGVGKTFPLPASVAGEFRSLGLSTQYGYYLFGNGLASSGDPTYPNPFNITQRDNFSSICKSNQSRLCIPLDDY
jgi:hypothetical protein